jgi:hypothetical protein
MLWISATCIWVTGEETTMSGSAWRGPPAPSHQVTVQRAVAEMPAWASGPSQSTPQSGGVPAPALAGACHLGLAEPLGPHPPEFAVPGPVAVTLRSAALACTVTTSSPARAMISYVSSCPVTRLTGQFAHT